MPNAENKTTDAKSDSRAARPEGRSLVLLTFILAIVFVGSGLLGHAPWKLHEVQNLEIVQTMTENGDFVVPMRADQVILDTPPLYFMTAVGLSEKLADYIPERDAARAATGLYLAITLLFAGLLGRLTWKPVEHKGVGRTGAMTVLILIGTLGIVWFGHDVTTDSALVAGVTVGLYGLLLLPRRVFWGGLWLGTGAGIAFMAKGLLGPAILGVTAVLMPFLATWGGLGRQIRGMLIGLLFALPWLAIWPWLLYQRDPQLLDQWLWGNNLNLYLDNVALGTPQENLQWLWAILIMAFPAWLLAVLALILRPFAFFGLPGVRLALLVSVVGWAVMLTAEAARPIHGAMLLIPLAVLGAGSITRMPGLLVMPVKWLSSLLFGAMALALWGLWGYLRFKGELPELPQIEQVAAVVPQDYGFAFQPTLYLIAAGATVLWLWIIMRFRSPQPSALLAWPAGVVMCWALLMMHQPLVDKLFAERGLIAEPSIGAPLTLQQPAQASGTASGPEAATPESESQPTAEPAATP
ncbi:hypothetical protein G3480_22225 [Thiorhodococcus mannitoliphagus]|uniref:Glycosyltransferase RgtA/B/C/D-like domain-containing protein n=1 Tax=Thiorhodococcus mannitoliphagus TaxID=329406 RepID=A0A6P1E169_9GAMM|nr:hypothetical protein [Thiorhodococcus mannitoliphagus]NEX22983.1 hypothetical protein [Thiorhodococcus mannitoliphagus]